MTPIVLGFVAVLALAYGGPWLAKRRREMQEAKREKARLRARAMRHFTESPVSMGDGKARLN